MKPCYLVDRNPMTPETIQDKAREAAQLRGYRSVPSEVLFDQPEFDELLDMFAEVVESSVAESPAE